MAINEQIILSTISKGVNEALRDSKKLKSGFADTGAKIAIAWVGVTKAFNLFGSALTATLGDASKFVKTSAQLNQAIADTGADVDSTRANMDAYSNALALSAGVSQDLIVEQQKLFVQMTGNTDVANDASRAALAMAEALGVDAQTAMRGLAQSINGNVATLGRYIPSVRTLTKEQLKAGDAVKLVAEQFGSALIANMQTVTGQYERLTAIIGDRYIEAVGLAITDNAAFKAGLELLGTELANNALKNDELKNVITQLAIALVDTIAALAGGIKMLADFQSWVFNVGATILDKLLYPLQLFIKALTAGGIALARMAGISEESVETLSLIGDTILQIAEAPEELARTGASVGESISNVASIVSDVGNKISASMSAAIGKTTEYKGVAMQATQNLNELKKAQDSLNKSIADGAKEAQEQMDAFDEARKAHQKWMAETTKSKGERETSERRAQQQGGPRSTSDVLGDVSSGNVSGLISGAVGDLGAEIGNMFFDIFMFGLEMLAEPEKLIAIVQRIADMMVKALENLANPDTLQAIIDTLVGVVVAIIDVLATPGFIGDVVVAVIRAIIEMVKAIIPKLPAIGWEIMKAIVRGLWEAIKGIGEAILIFFENIGRKIIGKGKSEREKRYEFKGIVSQKTDDQLETSIRLYSNMVDMLKDNKGKQDEYKNYKLLLEEAVKERSRRQEMSDSLSEFHSGGAIVAHNGMALRSDEVPIIAQKGEAVIPNAPKSFQGLSTDGNGNVRGSGTTVNINVSAMDSQSFMDFLRKGGAKAINEFILRGMQDANGRKLGMS